MRVKIVAFGYFASDVHFKIERLKRARILAMEY